VSAITPLVLAAGASSRMGRPKAALELAGRTALRRILDACHESGLARAIVVTGAHDARAAAAGAALEPIFVANPDWARGRATSIRAGLAALPAGAEAFLLWPVDVPIPGRAVVEALVTARARAERARAWIPSHAGRRGHPALFDRSVARELAALEDDRPARDVVRALAAQGEVHHVETDDPSVLWDMDSPEDHARLAAEALRRSTAP
jgi:CTP:molybdopterin cytidylyltransferase MocA